MASSNHASVCSYNMRGFKSGFNTTKELLDRYSIVAVQEIWLRNDNLSNLGLINDNISYFGVSGMTKALSSGVVHGRPFGGVAFLWKNDLSKFITKVGYDPAGRCIAIKLHIDGKVILLINVYFPCFKSGLEYEADLGLCIGFIDNMLRFESYSDVIITGDFNFTCDSNNSGFAAFDSVCSDHNIVNCDSLVLTKNYSTYENDALGHTSTIDHFFTTNSLRQLILSADIWQCANNLCDHKPIFLIFDLLFSLDSSLNGTRPVNKNTVYNVR
jgi:exonuclease III